MFRKLALFCVFLTFCVIVLGAYVRITDTGCSDWLGTGCPGKTFTDSIPPASSTESLPDLSQLDGVKVGIAMAHRYSAAGLGLFVLVLFALSFGLKERRVSSVLLSLIALSLVGLQAGLGVWAGRLLPIVVLAHLLMGLLTLGLLYWLYLGQRPDADYRPAVGAGLRWLARLGLLTLLLQIALGGWTSTNDAGLACPDFPTCLGSLNPPVDYAQAFSPSLQAGLDYQGGRLGISARAAIHWTHRLAAVLTFLLLSLLALSLSSNPKAARLSKPGLLLSFLLLLQIGLGLATVILRQPLPLTLAHGAVAALLWLNLLHIVFFLRAPLPAALPKIAEREEAEIVERRELEEIPAEIIAPPVEVVPLVRKEIPLPPEGLFGRLKTGLGKTRSGLTGFLANIALGKKAIDRDLLEDIEAQLLMADIGVAATGEIIADLTASLERHQLGDVDMLTGRLREQLHELIEPVSLPLHISPEHKPFVILVVGVNGVGKTTTIGKLAKRLQNQGHSVMLAAGDTFRAAAVEQLQTWGERNDIPVIAQHTGADSASVIYDGVQAAQARGVDVLIADTAGRLHTKSNLMEELAKIKRIMGKLDPSAPHEVLLVLDACTGQNAINQAKQFNEAVGLTGLVVTKLDGTAKGGVVFALAKQFGIPIRYIGVGETIDDLQDFDARKFIEALFAE
ncbi:MAG: signal recognition particle-docking protein FtsY [Methylococcaceae bacterium]|nr:signal recognition particle-docking protein FtsY [Methylococcaceae bacterium]